ncbi:hypothetical protein BEL04_01220 [Mucilaginibacter sp. PPCGB 2223]|uniref:hypothetical protein n=1 Tax=Mucilaginibacter sp. PPCGB 2223 TaxID=1886027 RepID=UPI00082691C7|nr:hypothetical protein [Mucilaginibacter sp. PPCGB 2223]OCX52977.1 hypothetical protein BEL04_01220 [Mucilaginibacter sp. PPCGB 2223]
MKKLLPLLFITLAIAGCKKGNSPAPDPNANNASKIVGKWKDGVATSIYYTGGKEVYRENYAAPTSILGYYEFTTGGLFNVYQLNGSTSTLIGSLSYTLTTNNTVLRLSSGSSFQDDPISFTDDNTLVITATTTSGVTYVSNNVTYNADKEVDYSTLLRMP